MRHAVSASLALALAVVLAACGGKESKKDPKPAPGSQVAVVTPAPDPEPVAPQPEPGPVTPPVAADPAMPGGHDFTPTANILLVVGACGEGPIPEGFSAAVIAKHCEAVKKTQAAYKASWVEVARPFFEEHVPKHLPKRVVYPFAGGDLSTALTVYPDADEITTLSLEPAGDPRTLAALDRAAPPGKPTKKGKAPSPNGTLVKALGTVAYELHFLYKVNFSNTMNMIDAMRVGALPTQLIFGLSALQVHGYEVVALRYFTLDDAGAIKYLTDEEFAAAPAIEPRTADRRNRVFANAELRFRKPGGRIQIYRHLQVNLDDAHLAKDPRVLRHLEAKGEIAGMTKAASYLLSWDSFKTMRDYLTKHVVWMVSDATGVAPKWGKPAGFEYETYGGFTAPHIDAGKNIAKNWKDEFASQPRRPLKFRFGYYDNSLVNHLVVMRRKPSP